MGPMIAQATGGDFWKVAEHLGLLAAIVGNISMAFALRKKRETRRIEPQPFDVRLIQSMATEKDCKERAEAAQHQISEMRNRREADMNAGSLSRKAIYEEIRKSNGESLDKIESVRAELNAQMLDMPDRIIATLRNFGVIGRGRGT